MFKWKIITSTTKFWHATEETILTYKRSHGLRTEWVTCSFHQIKMQETARGGLFLYVEFILNGSALA